MQIGLSSLVASSDEALGGAIGQEAFDFRPVLIKLTFAGSSWAPELHGPGRKKLRRDPTSSAQQRCFCHDL